MLNTMWYLKKPNFKGFKLLDSTSSTNLKSNN